MALTMAAPWRDKTGVWYMRQRTPQDLLGKLQGQSVTLPIGDGFAAVKVREVVQASLRTKDNREAKERHAVADAALRRFWTAQRTGPTTLTHRQITALSGTVYKAMLEQHRDNPGTTDQWVSAEVRSLVARLSRAVPSLNPFESLKIGAVEAARARRLNAVHGATVDEMLRREGLVVDAGSRAALLQAVAKAFEEAALQLRRNAGGDYRADPDADRFPAWVHPRDAEAKPLERLTVKALAEKWAAFQADKLAANSLKRYGASLRALAAFTGDRDATTLTGDDIHAWAVHRQSTDGIAARVVNKNDLVAVSSVFKWAMGREAGKLVPLNPATGIKLTEPKAVEGREKTFRDAEIAAILNAALAVQGEPHNPTAAFAKRWCPWLAAYSGARISELTGLLGSDVRVDPPSSRWTPMLGFLA